MFRLKSRSAAPNPAKELDRLISAEARLTARLDEVALRAASAIEKAKADAADIEAKAALEAEAEVDHLKLNLASEGEAALRRLAAEAKTRSWEMGPAEVGAWADRLVMELLASREGQR